MLNITSEQKDKVKQYVNKIDNYIETDNLEELLIDLDDAIISFGMDSKQDEMTEVGIELQKVYDQIYNQN